MTAAIHRNRSLKFEDQKGLIHKKAKLYYARLLGAQVMSVNFDDVFGELCIAFVKASRGYNAESEFTFTAYLGMCMQNHFNKFAKKLMLEQFGEENPAKDGGVCNGLGYISVEELAGAQFEDDARNIGSGYDLFEDSTFAGPEEFCSAASQLNAVVNDASLLPATRVYISMLADPSLKVSDAVKGCIRKASKAIRSEVSNRFGIQLQRISL